ncbi:MAG: hypothetical protein IT271_14160 [Chitinophagales bacterium]|nr:hypothetical protein [Chitinophagales bacterium]
MKKTVLCILLCFPVFLFAQKGTIIPDVKPQAVASTPSDTKTWIVEDYLLSCLDSSSKCYLIKENGVNKTVPVSDVYNFVFEAGNRYTIWVKEELKTPPISAFTGIYNYRVTKIVSKKAVFADASDIPTVSAKTPVTPVIIPIVPVNEATPAVIAPFENNDNAAERAKVDEEIKALKKQVSDLKKQLEVIQLQLDMQLQLFLKK